MRIANIVRSVEARNLFIDSKMLVLSVIHSKSYRCKTHHEIHTILGIDAIDADEIAGIAHDTVDGEWRRSRTDMVQTIEAGQCPDIALLIAANIVYSLCLKLVVDSDFRIICKTTLRIVLVGYSQTFTRTTPDGTGCRVFCYLIDDSIGGVAICYIYIARILYVSRVGKTFQSISPGSYPQLALLVEF